MKNDNKRINLIPLQNLKQINVKKVDNINLRKPILKNNSFFNLGELNDVYNKVVIKKNNSYNGRDTKRLLRLNCIPNLNEYKRLAKKYNDNIKYINLEEKNKCNMRNKNKSLENNSYNLNKNNNNLILNNYLMNNANNDLNINIIQNNNIKNSNKFYSECASLNSDKIIFQNNLKYSHLSPDQYNKYKSKMQNFKIKDNSIRQNQQPNSFRYKGNQIKLNISKKNSSYNSKNMKTNYLNTEKITCKPQKNIRIINIISPINKTTTYYKTKKNSLVLKSKKFYNNINNSINKSKTSFIQNNYYDNYNKNGLLSEYCSNASLIDKYRRPDIIINNNNKSNVIIDKSIKPYKIVKSNSNFFVNTRDFYDSNNTFNLKRNAFGNSLSYISPKSIEKYKKF